MAKNTTVIRHANGIFCCEWIFFVRVNPWNPWLFYYPDFITGDIMALQGPDADLTGRIIGCAFRVHAELGSGFLEKVYEKALLHELSKAGIRAEPQHRIQVFYDGVIVGDYFADILVEDRVILELKASKGIEDIHIAQTLHYLKATGLCTALILNFGTESLELKRLVR